MSGPLVHVDYVSDDTHSYLIRVPQWVATLTGAGVAAATASLPRGYKKRRRFYRVTATGKEGSFVVPNVGMSMWTNNFGAPVIVPVAGAATPAAANATLAGRTGERDKSL
jgi:hypothetical protein